jgi:hypothetical protein
MPNHNLLRLLRVALALEDADDILGLLVHFVNERITVKGEEFNTTDEDILKFFHILQTRKTSKEVVQPILDTCHQVLQMDEDIGFRYCIAGIIHFLCLHQEKLTIKEADNIERFVLNHLKDLILSENDCYKLCRSLVELGSLITLKSIEAALHYYIDVAIPTSSNPELVKTHSRSLKKSI